MKRYMFWGMVCALLVALGVLGGCQEQQPAPMAFGCGCPEQMPPAQQPLPPSPQQPNEANGSRLHPYQLVASDGTVARVPGRYHDELLGVSCSFVVPTDDVPTQYCLPEDATWLYSGYFNDTACSIPITFVGKCGTLPKYVKQAKENGCYAELTAFYEVIGTPADPASIYWKSQDGNSCIKQNNPATNSVVVLIGEVLPWETFVSASVEPMKAE